MPNPGQTENSAHSWQVAVLFVLSVIGAGIGYASSIIAARLLGAAAFENYAVAVATLGLAASIAEAGVGKYGLKVLPAFTSSRQWSLASGYLRFGIGLSLLISLILAVTVILRRGIDINELWGHPVGIAMFFLPAIAMSGVGVDFVMANRAAITGSFIARIIIPGTTLLILIAFAYREQQMSAGTAVASFGAGSVVGMFLCYLTFRRSSEPDVFTASPSFDRRLWLRECANFALTGFLMSWIFRVSIVILEILPIPESEVGIFAAALETGCLILLLSKSTDKLFQPDLSIIIQERNVELGEKMRSRRHFLIGIGCIAFLSFIAVGGRRVLGLYGEEFRSGYPTLCFVSVGACVWTLFSLAPTYLRFVGLSTFVIVATVSAAVSMAILTAVLGMQYGSTGAGAAFCIVVSLLAVTFFVYARRNLQAMRTQDKAQPASE